MFSPSSFLNTPKAVDILINDSVLLLKISWFGEGQGITPLQATESKRKIKLENQCCYGGKAKRIVRGNEYGFLSIFD